MNEPSRIVLQLALEGTMLHIESESTAIIKLEDELERRKESFKNLRAKAAALREELAR